jgi:hypothetical protein
MNWLNCSGGSAVHAPVSHGARASCTSASISALTMISSSWGCSRIVCFEEEKSAVDADGDEMFVFG